MIENGISCDHSERVSGENLTWCVGSVSVGWQVLAVSVEPSAVAYPRTFKQLRSYSSRISLSGPGKSVGGKRELMRFCSEFLFYAPVKSQAWVVAAAALQGARRTDGGCAAAAMRHGRS